MEQALVLKTHSFALSLHELLRELDSVQWRWEKRQALKDKIQALEMEVTFLYEKMKLTSTERFLSQKSAMFERLQQVRGILNELRETVIHHRLSVVAFYSLRKRLQKGYQGLALVLEAHKMSIPQIRPTNYARSLFHMGSAIFVLALIQNTSSLFLLGIALAFVLFCWTMEALKRVNGELKKKVMRFFSLIAHPHEYDKINSATWYGNALLVLSLLNSPVLGMIAVTILGFADPAAAVVGRRWGKIRLPGNRTLEGSLTFFIVGTFLTSLMIFIFHPLNGFGPTVFVAATASLCGALGELAGNWPDDNLTIPLASAIGASLALWLI